MKGNAAAVARAPGPHAGGIYVGLPFEIVGGGAEVLQPVHGIDHMALPHDFCEYFTGGIRIRNHSLHALWQQADTLPDQEQQALILVLDSFVKKAMVEKAVGRPANVTRCTPKRSAHAPA